MNHAKVISNIKNIIRVLPHNPSQIPHAYALKFLKHEIPDVNYDRNTLEEYDIDEHQRYCLSLMYILVREESKDSYNKKHVVNLNPDVIEHVTLISYLIIKKLKERNRYDKRTKRKSV